MFLSDNYTKAERYMNESELEYEANNPQGGRIYQDVAFTCAVLSIADELASLRKAIESQNQFINELIGLVANHASTLQSEPEVE